MIRCSGRGQIPPLSKVLDCGHSQSCQTNQCIRIVRPLTDINTVTALASTLSHQDCLLLHPVSTSFLSPLCLLTPCYEHTSVSNALEFSFTTNTRDQQIHMSGIWLYERTGGESIKIQDDPLREGSIDEKDMKGKKKEGDSYST